MRRNKYIILFSLCLIVVMAAILFLDLAGVFGYSDLPFLLAFFVYAIFIIIQRSTSRLSFGVALLMLLYMGLSYIPTATSRTTERFGEWFYLFFFFGMLQYCRELWRTRTQ